MDSKHVEALFAIRKALESDKDETIQYWLDRADELIGRKDSTVMFLVEAKKKWLPDG